MPPKILVVDDEKLIRLMLSECFSRAGYRALEAASGKEALKQFTDDVDLTLIDLRLPDIDGLTLMRRFREADPESLIILMTGYASIETAVRAIREGAYHYLCKPFDQDVVLHDVQRALETTQLRRAVKALRGAHARDPGAAPIIGESASMERVRMMIEKIARSQTSTVLITGESGTGKDLVAKSIHSLSDRAAKPFVNITCSALPEALLENELFGHERGAFTDAHQRKKGLFEQADGGTVFLDEIGEMTPALQAKMLRFLEEKVFRRVGGTADIHVDVRVIASTNRNLEDEVSKGRFRRDLYYRLRVMFVEIPPLRERREDIAALTAWYVDRFGREVGRKIRDITPEATAALEAYAWPGNVRELKNAVERAVVLCEGDTLEAKSFLPLGMATVVSNSFRLPAGGVDFEMLERDLVRQALARTKGNQTRAALLLGVNRDQIRYRIAKYSLERGPS